MLRFLMESSQFSHEQIALLPLPVMRELVLRCIAILLTLAIFPAAFFNWYIDLKVLAVLEWILVVTLAVNAWLLIRKNKRIFSPLALLIIAAVILVAPIALGVHSFIYFCFAFPVAFYLIVDRRSSIYLNVTWWVVCAVLAALVLEPLSAVSFVASHAAVCLFLEILFSIITRFENQLRDLSVRDPLTNAFNRRAMKEAMEYALQMHDRYEGASSILMIDIDRFKAINDDFGHKEGDKVLRGLVSLISQRLRRTDKLCRYGGEEFVVLLTNTDREQSYQLAESIRKQVSDAQLSHRAAVTISCGVAESRSGESVQDWLHRCDQALYRAKHAGRDRVELEAVA